MTNLDTRTLRNYSINNERRDVIDLTGITSSSTNNNNTDFYDEDNLLCDHCDVKLIEKKDDVAHLGYSKNRWICPSCGRIKDPLRLEDGMNNLKRQEKGQTIRGSSVGEGVPFAEVFSTTTDKDSLRGTQLSRTLQNVNDPEPNEEANLRGQGYVLKKTTTEYPASGRKVVKTFDD
jgi:hypothetical protein